MKEHSMIQKIYYSLRSKLGVMKNDMKSKTSIEIIKRLRMWRLGFTSEKYYLYNLKVNDFRDYLSDYCRVMTRFINYPYDVILNNKIIFEKIISQYIRVPKNYGFIDNGIIFPLQPAVKIDTIDSMLKTCKNENGLVIKPVNGGQGEGVSIIKIVDNEILLNDKKVHEQELENYITNIDNYIITEYIKQGQYSNKLYPYSTNTMRIVIMVDPYTNKPFVAGAAQRIGGKGSGGLDNFSQGGYSANIDLDSGKLSAAVTRLEMENLIWHDKHPDTGLLIKGVQVPEWNKIKNKLLSMTEELPYIKHVGWDVVLSDDDIVIIEGNNHPDPIVIQLHKPLLKNIQVKKFYEYYGII